MIMKNDLARHYGVMIPDSTAFMELQWLHGKLAEKLRDSDA
jgi:hypothetical protein